MTNASAPRARLDTAGRTWLAALVGSLLLLFTAGTPAAEPLRVFIRAGVKTHGPGQHDHPRFLGEWTKLLGERGLKVDGAMNFPSAAQLEQTDVVIIFAADGMKITGDNRANFEKFLKRGGGFVVLHDGVVSDDQHEWAKKIQGGAWVWQKNAPEKTGTKWFEGEVGVYFVDTAHPITRGLSNFDWKDEIYYDLDMAPDAKVLATSFHTVFVIAPQLWTYEKTLEGGSAPYRAFVSLPGHEYASFQTPHYRALLLRGLAWAGKRANVDEFCNAEELGSLTYPAGGPTAPDKAAAKLNVHPEFNVSLVAAEPLIEKAISLDWDARGRLWVADSHDELAQPPLLPRLQPRGRPRLPRARRRRADRGLARGTRGDRPARHRRGRLRGLGGRRAARSGERNEHPRARARPLDRLAPLARRRAGRVVPGLLGAAASACGAARLRDVRDRGRRIASGSIRRSSGSTPEPGARARRRTAPCRRCTRAGPDRSGRRAHA